MATECQLLTKIIACDVNESNESKFVSENRYSKTANINVQNTVYRLVNGGITHQKQQISEKGDSARQ